MTRSELIGDIVDALVHAFPDKDAPMTGEDMDLVDLTVQEVTEQACKVIEEDEDEELDTVQQG